MTKRLWVSIICFALVIFVVIFSTCYLIRSTAEMEEPVKEMISFLQADDIDQARESFDRFTQLYTNRRLALSVFLHDNKINEINLSINRLSGLFDEEFIAEALPEAESLLDNIYSIEEDNFPALEKIF